MGAILAASEARTVAVAARAIVPAVRGAVSITAGTVVAASEPLAVTVAARTVVVAESGTLVVAPETGAVIPAPETLPITLPAGAVVSITAGRVVPAETATRATLRPITEGPSPARAAPSRPTLGSILASTPARSLVTVLFSHRTSLPLTPTQGKAPGNRTKASARHPSRAAWASHRRSHGRVWE